MASEGDEIPSTSKPHAISVREGEETPIFKLHLILVDKERETKGEMPRKPPKNFGGSFSVLHNPMKSNSETARAIVLFVAALILSSWQSFQSRTSIAAALFEEEDVMPPNESAITVKGSIPKIQSES